MAEMHIIPGMGVVVHYECLDMHGYFVEASTSLDRFGFWPEICDRDWDMLKKIGLRGSYICRQILQLSGVKGIWIDPQEIIVHREDWAKWKDLDSEILGIIIGYPALVKEISEEITEEFFLNPLEENFLEGLQKL